MQNGSVIHIDSEQLTVNELLKGLSTGQWPYALWREPNEDTFHVIINFDTSPSYSEVDIDHQNTGFILAPFDLTNEQALFIRKDWGASFKTFEEPLELDKSDFPEELYQALKGTPTLVEKQQELMPFSTTEEEEAYKENVKQATQAIHDGILQKVVLSRTKVLSKPKNYSILDQYKKTATKNSRGFVSLVYLPWLNTHWLGATPETLVKISDDGIFQTMALAATQNAYNEDGTLKKCGEAMWSQKEIEEQALVSRYIISCFKKIRVREFIENGPKTIQAGNLLHLKTEFTCDKNAINFPELGSVMLDLLHPTSAVCGMPKDAAIAQIKKLEKHNRSFYSGFLGPVNYQNNTALYVNLRTMEISDQIITLYAGCGITADSNPEKEWLETEMKIKTVLSN